MGKVYYIKGEMNCESTNIIYLITCMRCLEQYAGSAIKFKSRFKIHKFDIKTKKDRSGTARHSNNKCCNSSKSLSTFTCPAHLEGILYL